jgi:hypothetical protein
LIDKKTGEVVRTGRTNDLTRCTAEHERKYGGDKITHKTDGYTIQRGLEQILYDQHIKTADLNKIKPISPTNPKRGEYLKHTNEFLKNQNNQ